MAASLTRRLAELEGAESALVLASGRAAVACTSLALLRPGDHLLASSVLRPSTRHFFAQELPALGVAVSYVDPRETRGWRRGLQRTTRALFVESPVRLTGRLVDLRPPRTLAHELGIALIVDATEASPINFTPLAHGADVVVHDADRLVGPHGEGAAGVVAGTDGLVEEVRLKMETWGAIPHPDVLRELDRGLATLEVRVHRQNATAQQLAEWAQGQRAIREVEFAGLPGHPDAALVATYFKGPGALLHLQLTAGRVASVVAARASARLSDDGARAARHVITRLTPAGDDDRLTVEVGLESADTLIAALDAALTPPVLSAS